jgi:8-oxo-dGTP pyrophosphatase MutT (NUDIX family)
MADLKVSVKGHTAIVNGKTVWVPEHESSHVAAKPQSKEPKEPPKPVWGVPKHFEKVIAPLEHHHEHHHAWESLKHWSSNLDYPAGNLKPEPKPWTGPVHPKQETWKDPAAKATFVPGGQVPAVLHGVPMLPWTDHPEAADDWDDVDGQDATLAEPELKVASGKKPAAGVVVEEPDGRVWVVHPSNMFAGYKRTFPKGHTETGINLQASAIKEAYEESGLKVVITGLIGDFERGMTTTRYYTARRVGGSPADSGWESQAVSLVPKSMLYNLLNQTVDHPIAEAIGAGPMPEPPPMEHHAWGPDTGEGLPF